MRWLESNAECLTSKDDPLMPWVDGLGAWLGILIPSRDRNVDTAMFPSEAGQCILTVQVVLSLPEFQYLSHSRPLSSSYFGRAGALRKLTRSPTSVAFRVGHGMPNSSARSIMRGPCRQSSAVSETVV